MIALRRLWNAGTVWRYGGTAGRRDGGTVRRKVIVVPSCVKMVGRSAWLATSCHPERSEGSFLETSANQSSARSFHSGFTELIMAIFFTRA